jgi:hypothetical protein
MSFGRGVCCEMNSDLLLGALETGSLPSLDKGTLGFVLTSVKKGLRVLRSRSISTARARTEYTPHAQA